MAQAEIQPILGSKDRSGLLGCLQLPAVPHAPALLPAQGQPHGTRFSHLMSMMTEGVCAMAPIMLQTHITQRNVRKASSQPGLGHLPGTTVAFAAGSEVRHEQPLRFCGEHRASAEGRAAEPPAAHCSQAWGTAPQHPPLLTSLYPKRSSDGGSGIRES